MKSRWLTKRRYIAQTAPAVVIVAFIGKWRSVSALFGAVLQSYLA
jgi:hypothetical protein